MGVFSIIGGGLSGSIGARRSSVCASCGTTCIGGATTIGGTGGAAGGVTTIGAGRGDSTACIDGTRCNVGVVVTMGAGCGGITTCNGAGVVVKLYVGCDGATTCNGAGVVAKKCAGCCVGVVVKKYVGCGATTRVDDGATIGGCHALPTVLLSVCDECDECATEPAITVPMAATTATVVTIAVNEPLPLSAVLPASDATVPFSGMPDDTAV